MEIKIVAEGGINANGDIETAKKLMKMAKDCGCDYIKWQKRDVETVYTQEFLNLPRQSPWGVTQREQKIGLEFGKKEYDEIDRYSKEIGIPWFAAAYDLTSLAFINQYDPPLHKIASPMITNLPFVTEVAELGKLTLISTGMCELIDVMNAKRIFEEMGTPHVLMHCVSEYPCPDEACNLAMIQKLKRTFDCLVGYSNHSPGLVSCIGAAFLGATWIEAHITLDRSSYGSDQSASIEEPGLRRIVEYCKLAPTVIGNGVKILREAERLNAKKMRYWED